MKLFLSKPLKYMIAKSDRRDRNGWLPFYIHALDTAAIIKRLIKHYGLDRSWKFICNMDRDAFIKTVILIALLHDIGKLTPAFQHLITFSLPSDLRYDGIPYTDDFANRSASHHTVAGECILIKLGLSKELSSIVGAHHGMTPENGVCKKNIDAYPDNYFGELQDEEFWMSIWKEWLEFSLKMAGFGSAKDVPVPDKKTQVLISGLLITADWLASDSSKFPLLDLDELPSDEYDEGRADKAWEDIGLTEPWTSDVYIADDDIFEERFGFYPNKVQKFVLDVVNMAERPGIMILEAPMGCGKTEAALMAAEVFAEKNDKHGVFFGLPTQTTANGIFERFKEWAEGQSEEFYHSLILAHANAGFQPAFENMPKRMPDVDEDSESGLIVHPFFMGRKMSCMSDFVVGTVDRMLMAALKRRHTMLLHFGLSQKVVIIDECHAYDAYMNRYLERSIEWLSAYGVPVILLSATLPPSRRRALVSAYTGEKPENIVFENETAYPAVTWSDGEKIYSRSIVYEHTNKNVAIERMSEDKAVLEAVAASEAGACVGIICNTVRKAQKVSEIIEKHRGTEKMILYHAQYIMQDRAEKEDRILKAAGKKSSPADRNGLIVIGTQVLEQSLDIDFDLLVTELCPMDLLLQRIGRLFRHDERERPDVCKQPRCIVVCSEEDEFDRGSEAVYGRWLLMQTEKYLPDKIEVPDDISRLVSNVYEKCSTDTEAEKKAYREYCNSVGTKKSHAGGYLLGSAKGSRRDRTLDGWLAQGVKDAKAEASVRDGDPSIEVLLMVSDGDGYASFLPWRSDGEKIPMFECPPDDMCKKIAMQRLKLPGALCNEYVIDDTIEELETGDKMLKAWQDSRWLSGELVLFMDRGLTARLNGFVLKYSLEKGLSYERLKEGED